MRPQGPKIEAQRTEAGRGSWGEAASPSPPATEFGGMQYVPPVASEEVFLYNFGSQDDLSEHFN